MLILIPLSKDVPNLSPEKCVRVQALLEDLANGRPNLDCHPSFCFGFGFFQDDPHHSRGASSSLRS